jgi:iron complex outermembrane receptor protein
MSLRRKLLAVAIAAGALVGSSGVALAQDQNPASPAQPTPEPPAPSTTPAPDTAQPSAPAPAQAATPPAETVQPPAAETVQPPVPEEAVAAPAPKRGAKPFGEEIVVTGSRIRRKDLTTPAPVAVLSKEQIQASGRTSLGDFLQSLPEQGNALNTQTNNGGSGATRINLRGLDNATSSQRTLVLLNGRRMVATGTGAVTGNGVDINTIPIAAVERIEVLKDGASSVYGSDAIAGVVNIITRKSYDGIEANAYEGITTHGDGNTVDLNVTAGTASDKGSFMFSGGFFDQQSVMAGDREWSSHQLDYDWNGNVTQLGSSRVPNGRVISKNIPGLPAAGSYTYDPSLPGCAVSNDPLNKPKAGCFRPFKSPADLYNFQPSNFDVTPNRRVNLFTTGELKLSETVPVKAFFEGSFTHRESAYQLAPEPLIIGAGGLDVTVTKDNYYNPFGQDLTQVTRRLVEFGPRRQSQTADTFRVVGGLNGQIPVVNWSWDAALIYGRTDWSNINAGNIWKTRLQNAVGPSFLDPATHTVTCGTAAAPIGGGCVPLNLFGGAGSISPGAAKYLGITTVSSVTNELTSVQLNTAGELPIQLLADRPLALAVGYEYRFEQGSDTPDAITAGGEDSNGSRVATAGQFHTNEVYAELSIPIINHVPWVENLEATASARLFDYSTFGSDVTYKFGGRYTPINDVTFRGTYSTAYRAPNVADLFTGAFDNFPTVSDPCAFAAPGSTLAKNCGSAAGNGSTDTQLRTTNGGNTHLKPETAKTYTAGVVIEPSMVKNLSFTVDYYHIDITNAIATQGAPFILGQCYPSAGNPNPAACALIVRDAQGFITRINDLNTNVGGTKTAGVDVTARYNLPTEMFGRFGFGVDANFLQFFDQIQPNGTVIHGRGNFDIGQLNNGIQGVYPTVKGLASVVWGLNGFGAGGTVHYIGNIKQCAAADGTSTGGVCYNNPLHMERDVGAYATLDLFTSYAFKTVAGTTSVAVGVNNLFEAAPRTIYGALEPNSDPTAYDFMGRFVYIRLGQRL